ncbi:hypothetical protein JS87_22375 [Vibrio vulnificus]|nr:hypothetical protein JS87_22375 [Vibrio vulnificus]RZQ17845.1 hypothetical protein D8T50_11545 [Vibrio vulnificus]RZR31977.1 hypothetical protein D8T61_08440 [Vibrio vulnificus]
MYEKYWNEMNVCEKKNLASMVNSTVGYLRLVMSGHKKPSASLAKRLDEQTNGVVKKTRLRPDIFEQ